MTQAKKDLPRLEGERVLLRIAELGDAAAIVAYFRENLERLRGSMPKPSPTFLTEDHWRTQALLAREEFSNGASAKLFVFLKATGAVSGTVNLSSIARGPAQYCNLGYGIAQGLEGKGYMTEALRLGLGYAFGPLGLHRVHANYKPTNARSGRLLRKLGFVVEGYARDFLLLDGKWEDHVLTSLTNPDWKAPA